MPADFHHGLLGRAATRGGLEVMCMRLGTIRDPDAPSREPLLRKHWLSHEDCAGAFRACLIAPIVPGRFSLFYAVSDLPDRVFDTANPLGWAPLTTALGLKRSVISKVHALNTGIRGHLQLRTRLKSLLNRRRS